MIGVVEASIEIDGNVSGLPALALVASLGNGAAFLGINIILQSQRFLFCTQISYKDRHAWWFRMTRGNSARNLSIGGKACSVQCCTLFAALNFRSLIPKLIPQEGEFKTGSCVPACLVITPHNASPGPALTNQGASPRRDNMGVMEE